MRRPEKPQARRLSKLKLTRRSSSASALTAWALVLSGVGGCRTEPPPGAQAGPTPVHFEVSVQNNQGQVHSLSAAEAAAPLKSKAATRPRVGDGADERKPTRASPKVAERDPSPPPNPKARDEDQDVTAKPSDENSSERGAVVPAGFSLGQDAAAKGQSAVPRLLDAEGELLPQTNVLPGTDSAFFKQLGPTLFKAIVDNDPELLLPYFMPLPVYEKLKDSKNPPRDWKYRLYAQLKRDIERYHRALGRQRERAHFVALDVVPEDALWMKPGREYNKLAYYRLFGSSLRYVDHRGRERRFEVSALFSWRGEWYVVHLNGLK